MPEVSICLTTYNRAHVLGHTIDSILAQTFTDFELIISDDNSPDHTRQLCGEYAAKDRRVKYFCNPQNLKMPGNLNNAISKATGTYVANLHDGDIYRPELIEKWKKALDTYPEALFVFNGYEIETNKGNIISYVHPGLQPINEGKVLMDYFLKHFTSAPWGTVMARREAYHAYGLFNADYGFISDVEMWLRLGTHGKVAYVPEALITLTPREVSHTYYYPHWNVIRNNFRILKRYYLAYKIQDPDSKSVNARMVKEAVRSTLILLKHKQWERLGQGIEILRKCPYFWTRVLARLFWVKRKAPDTVNANEFWSEVLL